MEKFYVVVRTDLDPGLLVAQACHAAYALGVHSPKASRENIAVLGATRSELESLVALAAQRGDCHQAFYEPDLGGELTAGAFDGSVKKIVRSLRSLYSQFDLLARPAVLPCTHGRA